jgi:hypothetical protein
MMKEEFEKRIGLVITSEEYADIEAAYMGLPESVDKDKFVKIWLREGGIQDLFDKRMLRVRNLMDIVRNLEEQSREDTERLVNRDEALDECKKQIKALKEKLAAIGAVVTEAVA